MTRILVADDHEVVRSGVRAILEAHEGWEVVAEAKDGKDAVKKAVETQPDVAIIDYSMPVMDGIEVTRQIHAKLPKTEILIFSMHDSDVLVGELLEAGARAYLLKSDANRYLIAAVEALAEHKPFLTGKISQRLINAFLADRKGQKEALSPRERVVVQLIAEGHSNREIGRNLKSQHQDYREPSRRGNAEAQNQIDRRAGALRRPQPSDRTIADPLARNLQLTQRPKTKGLSQATDYQRPGQCCDAAGFCPSSWNSILI